MRLMLFATGFILLNLSGCGSSEDEMESLNVPPIAEKQPPPQPDEARPFQELYEQGIDRYLGVFTPSKAETLPGGVTAYTFDKSADGPLCYTGNTFMMSTRDGSKSELMIFLQGGGVCGPDACQAVEGTSSIPPFGILGPSSQANPTVGYNVAYLPYCDGSLFIGDRESDDGRSFRGLKNLSASLDVVVNAYPSPSKILLIGNSAGGAATHYALPLVRKLYPDVAIELVNDSGPGVLNPGAQERLNQYWNSAAFFPDSCETCVGDDGNLTDCYKYQLSEDGQLRMGFVSSKQDEVIVGSLGIDGSAFEMEMLREVGELNDEFPNRYRSLIADGNEHTFVLKQFTYEIAGTTVQQWISDMLSGSEDWISLSD